MQTTPTPSYYSVWCSLAAADAVSCISYQNIECARMLADVYFSSLGQGIKCDQKIKKSKKKILRKKNRLYIVYASLAKNKHTYWNCTERTGLHLISLSTLVTENFSFAK